MTWSNPETFAQATSTWNLEPLYIGLAQAKQQVSFSNRKSKGLTETEKLHLRGLLCGHSPAEIATKLYKKAQGVEVELCKTIYRYVKELTGHTQDSINNWRNVVNWLEQAGYRKQEDDVTASTTDLDWGTAPSATNFYGRTKEINILKQWIVEDRCSLVGLLGMGGIGKTALAVQLVEQIYQEFDYVIWRSITLPPDSEDPLVQILPGSEVPDLSTCLDYLSSKHCLIVLDNFETVLNDNPVGSYQAGFEIYGELLQRIGNERHQSCLLVLSREQPRELLLSDDNSPMRSYLLGELRESAQILLAKKLLDRGDDWNILVKTYGGNPLALQLITTLIQKLFGGSVREFLKQDTTFFDPEMRSILTQQFDRLSTPEKETLLKLASTSRPFSLCQLLPLTSSIASKSELIAVIHSLQHRSLIEQQFSQGEIRFTLPQVVMKFARKI